MKKLAISSILLLSGCFSDTSDIKSYIANVQSNTKSYIAPMPAVPAFNHIKYSTDSERSPFILPKPEAIQERMQQMAGCLSPDPRRRKQPLEKFALDSLSMRGTLGELGVTWALIEAADSTIHQLTIGSYLGMYHGKITDVTEDLIKVLELIPDGAGCWVERESVISLSDFSAEGQRK
ncbi:MAG: pilus assembly protein PilP [Thalassotalea sp.]